MKIEITLKDSTMGHTWASKWRNSVKQTHKLMDADPKSPIHDGHSGWVDAPDCAGWWTGWDGHKPRLREVTEIRSRGEGLWIYENGFWRRPHELLWAACWKIVIPPNDKTQAPQGEAQPPAANL